jgi:hypothetical protein
MSETAVRPDDYGAAAFMRRVLRDSGKGLTPEQVEDLIPVLQSAARLQRVVDDLADVMRTVNARMEQHGVMPGASHLIRKILRVHGLLRACDDPAQVPTRLRFLAADARVAVAAVQARGGRPSTYRYVADRLAQGLTLQRALEYLDAGVPGEVVEAWESLR